MLPRSLLALALALAAPAAPAFSQDPPLAVTGVTLVDALGARPGSTVVIRDRRITAVGDADEIAVPPGARIVDGTGRWLIPGLWDLHVHLSKTRAPALPLFVASGVLSVRDLGGEMDEVARWEEEARSGTLAGPRIVRAGPYLESPSNVLRVLMAETVEPEERSRVPVEGPADARRVVDSIADAGVDVVKVRTWRDLETFRAIADAAADRGLPLVAHAMALPPEELLAGRVASVEHFYVPPDDWTEAERLSFYRELAGLGTVVVPTLTSYHESLFVPPGDAARILGDSTEPADPRVASLSAFLLADWREQLEERSPGAVAGWSEYYPTIRAALREMRAAGLPILAGSDVAVLLIWPGESLHRELELLVAELGMTPLEALTAATLGPAEHLGLADSLGTIEAGKVADLVLLDADPLAEISNTRRVAAVIQGGRLHDREGLATLRDGARAMPAIAENDWLPGPTPAAVRAASAIESAIREAPTAAAVAAAVERFQAFEQADELPGGWVALGDRVESAVNAAGYRFVRAEQLDEAVETFDLNTRLFPESANTWDSLGEANMLRGERELAVRHYRRSLELDPGNDNAREKLAELGAEPPPGSR